MKKRENLSFKWYWIGVVAAYKDVLDNLESEVGEVLRMEANERKILAAENQINRMEKKFVKGETPAIQRSWFQSEVERRISRSLIFFSFDV